MKPPVVSEIIPFKPSTFVQRGTAKSNWNTPLVEGDHETPTPSIPLKVR